MKKTYYSIFMIFALLLNTACGGNKQVENDGGSNNEIDKTIATVNASSGLTLRAKPSGESAQVALLENKSKVEVLDKNGPAETIEGKKGNWYKVKSGKDEGYVFSGFLLLKGQEAESTQKTSQKSKSKAVDLNKFNRPNNAKEAYVAAPSGVKLRSKPDIGSEEVTIAPYDAQLKVIDENNAQESPKCIGGVIGQWIKVKYNDKEGYVVNAFLRLYANSSRPLEMEVVTPSGVILRNAPTKDGKQVIAVPTGAMLEIVNNCDTLNKSKRVKIGDRRGTWIQVRYKGKVGYVFDDFLMPIMA